MKTIIKIDDLVKTYKSGELEVNAINHINLEFEEGEFTAIVGPSGSGKTTFLNMLGGLDKMDSGEIVVDGTEVNKLKASELINYRLNNIGFVFQAYNLIPVLTAKENVEFIMQLQGIKKRNRTERSLEVLKSVGLEGRENARPSKLSGGQQQRVAVARALASRPKFVLADEPTANLDSKSTSTLLDIMLDLNKKEKTTFIFSTHDQRVVNKARRVITIEDGKVISDVRK
jgi:putative ABC transport system ATP-binding protein